MFNALYDKEVKCSVGCWWGGREGVNKFLPCRDDIFLPGQIGVLVEFSSVYAFASVAMAVADGS